MKRLTLDSYPKGTQLPLDPVGRIPWTLRQYFRFARTHETLSDAIKVAKRNYGGTPATLERLFTQAKEDDARAIKERSAA